MRALVLVLAAVMLSPVAQAEYLLDCHTTDETIQKVKQHNEDTGQNLEVYGVRAVGQSAGAGMVIGDLRTQKAETAKSVANGARKFKHQMLPHARIGDAGVCHVTFAFDRDKTFCQPGPGKSSAACFYETMNVTFSGHEFNTFTEATLSYTLPDYGENPNDPQQNLNGIEGELKCTMSPVYVNNLCAEAAERIKNRYQATPAVQ